MHAIDFHCAFTPGGWQAGDWLLVRRADWDHYGSWLQGEDYIENETPAVTDPAELEWAPASGTDAFEAAITHTHAGMVYHEAISGNFEAASTLAFTRRMAPSIVFGLLTDSARPTHRQYCESWEIVLWDEGINVWHQTLPDGRVLWELIGYAKFPLRPHARYALAVRREGNALRIEAAGHAFGLLVPSLPPACHLGITGCEGINRFYDFRLQSGKKG